MNGYFHYILTKEDNKIMHSACAGFPKQFVTYNQIFYKEKKNFVTAPP